MSKVPPVLQKALDGELDFLQQLCGLTLDGLLEAADAADPLPFLPRWETKDIDLRAAYAQRMSEVGKKGYGMFAKHQDRKSTRLNSSHTDSSRMPSSA